MSHRIVLTALPFVVPLGMAFPTASFAQTALTDTTFGYVLDGSDDTSYSIAAGTIVESEDGIGIFGADEDWTLLNLGTVRSTSFGSGIEFVGGTSEITNGSDIVAGTIDAANNGIRIEGNAVINNLGLSTITGYDSGIIVEYGGLTLDNEGTITGGHDGSEFSYGVYVSGGGGTIVNREGATIEGIQGGATYADTPGDLGHIENYGKLIASLGIGANTSVGTITNFATGEISGGRSGVQVGTGTFTNHGSVTATGYDEDGVLKGDGVTLNGEGTVDNKVGATISGEVNGVAIESLGTIINQGTIKATGSRGNGILFVEDGGGQGTITNSGTIIGGANGYAILSLSSYSSELILLPGSTITGRVSMGSGADDRLTFGGTIATSLGGLDKYENFEFASVLEDADWTLDGTLNLGEFTNNGTLQAGALDKKLTINGSFIQSETGTLRVVAAGDGSSSQLRVKDASLAGVVFVDATGGGWSPVESYAILVSENAVSGAFEDATTNLAFYRAILGGNDHTVTLSLIHNDATLSDFATSANHSAVAGALTGSDNTELLEALDSQTVDGVRAAFDALAGNIHSGATGQGFAQAGQIGGVVMDRTRNPHGTNSGSSAEPLGYAAASVPAASAAAIAAATRQPGAPRIEAWSEAFGGIGGVATNGNAPATNWLNGGVVAGLDVSSEAWRVGLGGSLGKAAIADGTGTANVDSYTALVYASHEAGLLAVRGGASYGVNSISTERDVTFLGEQLTASYGGYTAQVFGEAGVRLPVAGNASVEPYVGLAYGRSGTEAAQETGGVAALAIAATDVDRLTATVGFRAETTMSFSDTLHLTPRLGLAWQRSHGNAPASTNAFASGPNFTVTGANAPTDVLLVDLGADLALDGGLDLGLDYRGAVAEAGSNHQLKGRLGKAF